MFFILILLVFSAGALAESSRYLLLSAEIYRSDNRYSGPYYSPENKRKRQQIPLDYYYEDRSLRYQYDYYRKPGYRDYPRSHSVPTLKPKAKPKVYRYYH
jgi:hypothetical protein